MEPHRPLRTDVVPEICVVDFPGGESGPDGGGS